MSNKIFTATEIKILSMNPYVKKVSSKGITYADEFKRIFISENEKGNFPREIFEAHGFDIQILGMKRVESSEKRWRAAYRKKGARQIKMTLATHFGINYNLKRIRI